jgi:hypothetical protein
MGLLCMKRSINNKNIWKSLILKENAGIPKKLETSKVMETTFNGKLSSFKIMQMIINLWDIINENVG